MPESGLILTLALSLLIQAAFFAFAATFRTDKVTDLSYSLTFVILSGVLAVRSEAWQTAQIALTLMVVVWGLRLGTYLLVRIRVMQRDPRFDGIRENFWKFLRFWLLQGVAAWAIMLPVTVGYPEAGAWNPIRFAGMIMWAFGFGVESVADHQKFRQKRRPGGRSRWMSSGLWRYSRHPNYFGELLCWWGIFLFVAGDLGGWGWLSVSGPLLLTYLLLCVTGIPTLEIRAREKWGTDPGYQAYRRSTALLIPWFPSRRQAPFDA